MSHSPLEEGEDTAKSTKSGKHLPNCVPQDAGSMRYYQCPGRNGDGGQLNFKNAAFYILSGRFLSGSNSMPKAQRIPEVGSQV